MESKSLRSLKGPVLIQLSFLLCFWLIYVALERDVIYRKIGEYYEASGDTIKTIENWEKALTINPSVGIKRKFDSLKKSIFKGQKT